MKRSLGLVIILIGFFFYAFLLTFSNVCAVESNEDLSNISNFLDFEKAIIELNNDSAYSNFSNNQRTLSNYSSDISQSDAEETESKFALKRVIVQGNVKNTYGAIDVISYNDLHILCYNSEKQTQYAYEQLTLDSSLEVIVDEIQALEEYAEKDYDYSSYQNWGAESIDIGGYRQFLVDNRVNKEIVVVVLDTGINTSHEMFANRLLTDKNGRIRGFSYYDSLYQYSYDNLAFDVDDENKYSFEDDYRHGAHVAGIICSLTPENVKILPIKIGDSKGYSSTSVFISAYLRVINIYSKQYNIVATNLSFSGAGKDSESEKETFNEQCYGPLIDMNILPITAAGNEYAENNIEDLKAVVVSALKKQNKQYIFDKSYSNYGKIIDISAPGTDILSAGIASTDGRNSSIVSKSGTSMASPQVAAVVALLYLNPNLPANFTTADIEKSLYDNALDMGSPGKDIYYGEGILNLKYFEIKSSGTLSFYKNGEWVNNYIENENFEEEFTLEIRASNSEFDIIYTTDKTMPSFNNRNIYSNLLNIDDSITIYAMGVKIVNNEIVARTNLYNISYFSSITPIEDCFTVSSRGYLDNYTGNYTTLNIPSTINGKTIYGLEPSLFKNSNIERITLPETITTIGGYAFQDAKNLKYIYAPNVTKIYIAAFSNCESLKLISDKHPTNGETEGAYFPNLTETVGYSFSNCKNLESVSLSKLSIMGDNGYDFQGCSKLAFVYLPLITSIPEGTFYQSTDLKGTFNIGAYVETIGARAFRNTQVTQFIVSKNNKYLYTDGLGVYSKSSLVAYASENKNIDYEILNSVIIDNVRYRITTIEESTMANTSFDILIIPSSIELINSWAFADSVINTLYFNAQNCSHSGYFDKESYSRSAVFYKINTIEIGANVKNIPERLFQAVYFDTLIINSYSTTFSSASFYRMKEQGVLNKLVINFTNTVSSNYLTMLVSTSSLFTYSEINYLYSKTEIPTSSTYGLNKLIYRSTDGDYIIYSKEPIEDRYKISASSNTYGNISPQGITYIDSGSSQTYLFTPNSGYYVERILIDNVALTGDELADAIENGYTFTNVISNHTISVIFAANSYNITYKDQDGNILSGLTPVSYTYGIGASLPTFVSKEGYSFAGWYEYSDFRGETITKVSIYDVGDKVYYAKFNIKTYIITVVQSEHGIISEALSNYNHGSNALFTITADEGYHTGYLLIDGVKYTSSLSEYRFTNITSNHTISAVFFANTDIQYTVRHWQESLISGGATLIGARYYNLVATDVLNDGITGAQTDVTANTYTGFSAQFIDQKIVLTDGSTVVDILYNRNVYYVTLIKGTGIDKVTGDGSYLYGQVVRLNAITNEGYIWSSWKSSNESVIESNPNIEYTFSMPADEIIFTATAILKQYTITIKTANDGTISYSRNISVNHGENKAFTFTLGTGYRVISIIVDDVKLGQEELLVAINEGYTFENIVRNHTIEVIFEKQEHVITVLVQGDGTINPNGEILVSHGENQLFNFEANEDSVVSDVLIDGKSIGELESYEFINVSENHEIKVIFEKKTFKVEIDIYGKGSFESADDLDKVEYGDNVSISIIADAGYKIDEVWINKTLVEVDDATLEISNVKSDIKVTLMFDEIKEELESSGKTSSSGFSCSKSEDGEGNISDFLFVVFTMLGFAFFRKRIFK